jgi:PEGA domain-containing protein
LDGSYIGRTPSTIGVPGGQHTVRMSKDGYRPYENTLETAGDTQTVHADLKAAQ